MSDDADGGRRGLRADPTPELRRVLAQAYDLDLGAAEDLRSGLNLNLAVPRGSERYVVRVYRPYVTEARLTAIQHVRRALDRAGVPCALPVPTLDGASWVRVEGRVAEVERFVDHDGRMNTAERLVRGLPMLGRIHSVLRDLDIPAAGRQARFVNHIEAGDVLAGTARGTARIRGWRPTPAERRLADRSDALADRVAEREAAFVGTLPRQVVHGDFWDNNVFFAGDRLVLVADFDFIGERTRIDDLALTLYFADCAFGRTDTVDRIAALVPLVEAYDETLEPRLSEVERAALPWAVARQPLWGIGHWVAALDDEDHARAHAHATATDVERALSAVEDADRWADAFA